MSLFLYYFVFYKKGVFTQYGNIKRLTKINSNKQKQKNRENSELVNMGKKKEYIEYHVLKLEIVMVGFLRSFLPFFLNTSLPRSLSSFFSFFLPIMLLHSPLLSFPPSLFPSFFSCFLKIKIEHTNLSSLNAILATPMILTALQLGNYNWKHIYPCGFYSKILKEQAIYATGGAFCSENYLWDNHLCIEINP